jgi:5-methylcytosine-specific restriction enzyme A
MDAAVTYARSLDHPHKLAGKKRSTGWRRVRAEHLRRQPRCAVCGGTRVLEVHHVQPFHLHPDLELDPKNLITLCESPGLACHHVFGHLGDWKSWNIHVRRDAQAWGRRLAGRPYPGRNPKHEIRNPKQIQNSKKK